MYFSTALLNILATGLRNLQCVHALPLIWGPLQDEIYCSRKINRETSFWGISEHVPPAPTYLVLQQCISAKHRENTKHFWALKFAPHLQMIYSNTGVLLAFSTVSQPIKLAAATNYCRPPARTGKSRRGYRVIWIYCCYCSPFSVQRLCTVLLFSVLCSSFSLFIETLVNSLCDAMQQCLGSRSRSPPPHFDILEGKAVPH
jgi:hypothetical protein